MKEKNKNLSIFLPKNLLSDLEEIPYEYKEEVYNFYLIFIINILEDSKPIKTNHGGNNNFHFFCNENENNLKYSFNRNNSGFSSFSNEEKPNIINSCINFNPGIYNSAPNYSGKFPNITNNINIKNVNILNYKEPVNFNENINNKLLFERFNVNKPLDNNNYMNFNFGNSFESCHYINFPTINENNINSDN